MRVWACFWSACLLAVVAGGCDSWNRMVVKMSLPDAFSPENDPSHMEAAYDGPDAARERIPVRLLRVAGGYAQPTDIQFVPQRDDLLVVTEKTGSARWENLLSRKKGILLTVPVTSDSEQGLLGLAFHPHFLENGKLYIDYTTRKNGGDITRISEFKSALRQDGTLAPATDERVILEVAQPYANHNAGQIFFSPEGYLFITLGDGGFEGDPGENAQNPGTLLGSLLRIDVDHPANGKPYGIPKDNPFLGVPGALPEIYAIGLRNPWRASLDPRGRVVAGDVGQELWEEVSIIEAGKNYGWNVLEGTHCYKPPRGCKKEGLVPPIHEYGHGAEGQSVTGGYVYTASRIPKLQNKYVFGDFVTGRLWALDLPADGAQQVDTIYTLGQWPILPSTFGRNPSGDVFVADFSSGSIFALAPAKEGSRKRDERLLNVSKN